MNLAIRSSWSEPQSGPGLVFHQDRLLLVSEHAAFAVSLGTDLERSVGT